MRVLGYDAIRLNLSGSLLEPSPGHINRQYINRIAQDAWSKYLYSSSSDHCTAPCQPVRG